MLIDNQHFTIYLILQSELFNKLYIIGNY